MKLADFIVLGFINILGFVQGVTLGLFFIFNAKKSSAFPLIGTFLIAYSADLGLVMLESAGYLETHPHIRYLPFRFYLLFMPLLYLYLKAKTHHLDWRKDVRHLIPGLLEFGVLTILFFYTSSDKASWMEDGTHQNIEVAHILTAAAIIIGYSTLILKYLNRHQEKLAQHFSSLEGKTLYWIKWMTYYIIIDAVFVPVLSIGFPGELELLQSILLYLNVLFIFWVTFLAFRQIFILIPVDKLEKTKNPEKNTIQITDNAEEREYQGLLTFMKEEEPFTNEQLTLTELSRQLKISKRTLSTLINDKTGKNFSQFVNEYRVEKAKSVLSDPKFDYLNMLGIAFQVGFSSKSSFYLTFKKMTGKTPAKFQKSSRSQK